MGFFFRVSGGFVDSRDYIPDPSAPFLFPTIKVPLGRKTKRPIPTLASGMVILRICTFGKKLKFGDGMVGRNGFFVRGFFYMRHMSMSQGLSGILMTDAFFLICSSDFISDFFWNQD